MKDRDKELEDNDVYRIKIWHENLDLINKSLSDMLGCISKLERTVNQMGLKQDTLINLVNLTNDLISTDKVEPTPSKKKRPDITFSKFSLCLASFDLDPPTSYQKHLIRKGRSEIAQLFSPLYFFNIINIVQKSVL